MKIFNVSQVQLYLCWGRLSGKDRVKGNWKIVQSV